jgi:hypothetical protein
MIPKASTQSKSPTAVYWEKKHHAFSKPCKRRRMSELFGRIRKRTGQEQPLPMILNPE